MLLSLSVQVQLYIPAGPDAVIKEGGPAVDNVPGF
jgi:hypothetical protein